MICRLKTSFFGLSSSDAAIVCTQSSRMVNVYMLISFRQVPFHTSSKGRGEQYPIEQGQNSKFETWVFATAMKRIWAERSGTQTHTHT